MFPESHSHAFAVPAYQVACLKRCHPLEFFVALMNNQPTVFYPMETPKQDARRFGVPVLNPCVNRSRAKCAPETGDVQLILWPSVLRAAPRRVGQPGGRGEGTRIEAGRHYQKAAVAGTPSKGTPTTAASSFLLSIQRGRYALRERRYTNPAANPPMTTTIMSAITHPGSPPASSAGGVTVGIAVGIAVGTAVGLAVGTAVGLAVGTAVGLAVGTAVGLAVGTAVGLAVGTAVGLAVGTAVGLAVGTAVGLAVGTAVGLAVGTAVGLAVGTAVGLAVGTAVGLAVGVVAGASSTSVTMMVTATESVPPRPSDTVTVTS